MIQPTRTPADTYAALISRLTELGSVLVAYSGGVDSTLLAFAAQSAPDVRSIAVMATSPTAASSEVHVARALAAELGLSLVEIESRELDDPRFAENTPDRCYWCKQELFGLLTSLATDQGFSHVADGCNADDTFDHRPGSRAAAELGIVSPLRDVGMTKDDIRAVARDLKLPNWDKPSMACLASRFPYGEAVTGEGLARVAMAEAGLAELGLAQYRVRSHGDTARVEVAPDELERAWTSRDGIVAACRTAGFAYTALDLEGYRTGSMNEVLPND